MAILTGFHKTVILIYNWLFLNLKPASQKKKTGKEMAGKTKLLATVKEKYKNKKGMGHAL